MIEFAFPWAFIALPLPYLVWRFVPAHREKVPALRVPFFERVTQAAGVDAGPGSVILTRHRLQMSAAILVWILTVCAMARPEHLGQPVEIEKSARDIILSIDISGSMDARDMAAPDGSPKQRLAVVQDVVSDFVASRQGDRVSLIVFGSKAFVQAPLTEDLQTIDELLRQTTVGMAGPHTAIGDSIGLAIRGFDASEVKDRLMILLSDGADTASRMSPINAAEIAKQNQVEIYTIAVGDPKSTGENRVDVATLDDIAKRTGGQSFFANDEAGLAQIYSRIDELTPREIETLSYRPRRSVAVWPLAIAALIGLMATGIMMAGIMTAGSRRKARA